MTRDTPCPGSALQAVLFDMDGLLVDSEPLWFEVERGVMARLGGEWAPRDQQALLGGSLDRTVSYLLGKAEPTDGPLPGRQEVGRWLLDGMAALMTERGVPLLPGAAALVAEVARAGVPRALVTSSRRAIMRTALAVTGLAFPVTVCGDDVVASKPDPEPYLRAVSLLGVSAAGCVVLEDSPSGIASAQAAGCGVIAVPSMPLPPRAGLLTVPSLAEVDLALLRRVAAGRHLRPGALAG